MIAATPSIAARSNVSSASSRVCNWPRGSPTRSCGLPAIAVGGTPRRLPRGKKSRPEGRLPTALNENWRQLSGLREGEKPEHDRHTGTMPVIAYRYLHSDARESKKLTRLRLLLNSGNPVTVTAGVGENPPTASVIRLFPRAGRCGPATN